MNLRPCIYFACTGNTTTLDPSPPLSNHHIRVPNSQLSKTFSPSSSPPDPSHHISHPGPAMASDGHPIHWPSLHSIRVGHRDLFKEQISPHVHTCHFPLLWDKNPSRRAPASRWLLPRSRTSPGRSALSVPQINPPLSPQRRCMCSVPARNALPGSMLVSTTLLLLSPG